MPFEWIPNHTDYAVARLAEQYKGSPRVVALIRAFAVAHQQIEDSIAALYEVTLDSAIGHELDVIGATVGQARHGKTDDSYRLWIRARLLANRSAGTAEEILAIAWVLTRGTTALKLIETYPAGIVLYVGPSSFIDPVEFEAILNDARAAGVSIAVRSALTVDPTLFGFGALNGGFGSESNSAIGGKLVSVYSGTN